MSNLLFGVLLFLVGVAGFVSWSYRNGYIGIYVDFPTLTKKLMENLVFSLMISGLLIVLQVLLTEFL
jgi:hypothetical protein